MAEDTLTTPSGRELNQQQLFAEHIKNNPDDRTATPEGVWNYYTQLAQKQPDQYKLNTGKGYFGRMASSVPGSAVNFAGGFASLFTPQTWINMAKVGHGMYVNSMIPRDQQTEGQQEHVKDAEGFKGFIANRIAHPVDTLRDDPIGGAADAATALSIGSGVGKLAEAATGSTAAARFARMAGTASEWVNPAVLATKPLRYAASKTGLPTYLYRSSLTPLADQSVDDINNAVKFGLNDVKMPSGPKGSAQLGEQIDAITKDFDNKAFEAEKQGKRYDPMTAANQIDELIADATGASNVGKTFGDRISPARAFPKEYVQALENRKREFLERYGAKFDPKTGAMTTPPSDASPVDARAIHRGANIEIGDLQRDNTDNLPAKAASVRAVRSSVLEDHFRKWFPDMKDEGQREAMMIDLKNMMDAETRRRMGGSTSSDIYSLSHAVKAPLTGAISPIAITTWAKKLMTPGVTSRMALRLAHKYPALVRTYGSPLFWGATLGNRSQEAGQQEPPTPKGGKIEVGGDWMKDQVPEAHQ